jgi:hypothetical protein
LGFDSPDAAGGSSDSTASTDDAVQLATDGAGYDEASSPADAATPVASDPGSPSDPPSTNPENTQYITPPPPPGNAAPRIVDFAGVEIVGGLWEFSGDVVDETPAGLTVTFGGEPDSLQGVFAVTDASGHFERTVFLNTDGSDNGLATTQTVDPQGLDSNIAAYYVIPG